MSPADARAEAVRAFGPVGVIEEECRDTRRVAFVEHLVQDLRYSLRGLVRQPLLVAAATLSIGAAIGANTTVFNLANQLLLSKPTAQRPEQLIQVRWAEQSRLVPPVARFRGQSHPRRPDRIQHRVERQLARARRLDQPDADDRDAEFLRRPGHPGGDGPHLHRRRSAPAERNPAVAVISHGFWQHRLAGDPQAVGRILRIQRPA